MLSFHLIYLYITLLFYFQMVESSSSASNNNWEQTGDNVQLKLNPTSDKIEKLYQDFLRSKSDFLSGNKTKKQMLSKDNKIFILINY